jgi:hypothetical protein
MLKGNDFLVSDAVQYFVGIHCLYLHEMKAAGFSEA